MERLVSYLKSKPWLRCVCGPGLASKIRRINRPWMLQNRRSGKPAGSSSHFLGFKRWMMSRWRSSPVRSMPWWAKTARGNRRWSNALPAHTHATRANFCFGASPFASIIQLKREPHGVATIYQEFSLVPTLSVAENIFLGNYRTRKGTGTIDWPRMREDTRKVLEQLSLSLDPDAIVSTLSVAEQQLVEIAKAISIDSSLLIMDEPTAALGLNETKHLLGSDSAPDRPRQGHPVHLPPTGRGLRDRRPRDGLERWAPGDNCPGFGAQTPGRGPHDGGL